MRGEVLFEKMTGISEEYITEAALVPAAGASPAQKPEGRFAALSRVLNSGWGVACICFIVAIAAVVGMVAWGRMGEPVDPFDPGSDPNVRYTFTLESMIFANGQSVDRAAEAGEDLHFSVMIRNHGPAFQITPYDWDNVRASCVLQGDDNIVLEWSFSYPDGLNEPYWMNMGDQAKIEFHLTIPENATPGVYDLVLSYKGVEQVFSGALTVGEPEPPIDTTDRHDFSFGYELAGDALTGAPYLMDTWVTNEGKPFTFEGSSMDFSPTAALIHMETQYRINGTFDKTTEIRTVTVNTGDVGRATQEFFIPDDAPTGAYALQLSYGGVSKSFPGVVIVAEPTVIDPAILYNLIMPIGSDWLFEPLQEAYPAGEEVTVRIKFATDVGTLFFLNGEVITPSVGDNQHGYWRYHFIMPKKDSVILFHTYDGTAPYYKMLEACICNHPYDFREDLFYYYGEFGDGVMVGLQLGYGEAIWSTTVGGYTFVTPNTHDMLAFYNGALYELQEAYDMGLLTDGDLEAMLTTHKKWFPYD